MRNRRRDSKSHRRRNSDTIGLLFLIALFVGIGYFVFALPSITSHEPVPLSRANVGDVAPDFRLPTANGGYVSLKELKGSWVLVFFNEGTPCEVCWREMVELQNSPEMIRLRVALVIVTADHMDQLQPIVDQYGIRAPVASDEALDTSRAYNALSGASVQKPTYTLVLIGPDGAIKWPYDSIQNGGRHLPISEVIVAVSKARGKS